MATNIVHAAMTDSDGLHLPKGVSTATSNQIYVSDGAGSGTWTDVDDFIQYSSICVSFDQTTTSTRVIPTGSINTVLPFSLSYLTGCDNGFVYSDINKDVEYTGTQTLTTRFDMSFSVGMPSGIGVTLLIWLQENTGSGWVTLDRTLGARKFSNNDVGMGAMTSLLSIETGYKYRPVFMVDTACTISVANITYNFTGLRDLSI
jgi:hypothetical protein